MKNTTIVLIDDSMDEVKLCREVFKRVKTESSLVTFNEPEQALEYIREHAKNIFVIICDISMPSMSGMELRKIIMEEENLRMEYIPFVFLSNSAEKTDIRQAYSLSANGYFQKPMDIDGLCEIFNNIISYWNDSRTINGANA